MMVAAAQATDLLVLAAVMIGAVVALTGVASFDPRIRSRFPVPALAHSNALVGIGLTVAGLVLVVVALGVGE